MKVKPMNSRIFVKALPDPETSEGGIVLTGASKDGVVKGVVMGTSEERTLKSGATIEFSVKRGDTVFFEQRSATKARIEGEEIYVLKEEDILAVYYE